MSIAYEYNKIDQMYINNTGVNKMYRGTNLVYDRSLQNKFEYFFIYADQPISSESAQAVGTISLVNYGNNAPNLEYSSDGINWTTWDYSSLTLYGPVDSEESSPIYSYIFFRGYNPNGFSSSNSVYSKFKITDNYGGNAAITIGGNIMSLLYKDSFWKEDISPNNIIPSTFCFYRLFYQSDIYSCLGMPGRWQQIHPLYTLRLPATTLTASCYREMFMNCTKLVYGPLILPAENLTSLCYNDMFNTCSSMLKTPLLPSTTLANDCYCGMFLGCSSLTEAAPLRATVLVSRCYAHMFQGCSSLVTAPEILGENLEHQCFNAAFRYCSSLNYIKVQFNSYTSSTEYTDEWMQGVAASGTFVKKRGVTYPTGRYGIPSGWTVEEID